MEILELDLELGKVQNVTWASARRILDKGQTIATLGIEAWVLPICRHALGSNKNRQDA